MTVNKATFSKMNKVSRAAVTMAVKSGKLVEDSHGMIDDRDPVNAEWLARRRAAEVKAAGGKAEKPPREPKAPKPARPAAKKKREVEPEADRDIDEIEDGSDGDDYEDYGVLSIQKTQAEIRFKNEQADTALQKRLERLGQLVDRELVTRAFAKIGQELKIRFIELPQRSSASLVAMVKGGSTEIEIQKYLEDEISRALQAVKAATEDF